jgi:hypothetical protein
MRPDLSCRHFFSACFIYASPSLSSLFSFLDMASLGLAEEAAATIRSSRWCQRMFLCSVLLYHWAHPSILEVKPVESRMDNCMQAGTNQRGGYKIDNKKLVIANSKSHWITQAFATVRLPVAQMPSLSSLPQKKCGPKLPCHGFPNHLLHTKTIQVRQSPLQLPLINIFVRIDTQDKLFAILSPLHHVPKKIVAEACVCTGVVF